MNEQTQKKVFEPGYYGKKRLSASAWTDMYIKKWEKQSLPQKDESSASKPYYHICFSRKIGVGALEVADLLSEKLSFRVIDREILEYMAENTNLTQKMIEYYDERYPGRTSELFSMLINEKTFTKSDYARQLLKTVSALVEAEPTIFVGRGTHLILPRDAVLSVRLECSRETRINRLSKLMHISLTEADRQLKVIDSEQKDFFRRIYNLKEISNREFDLVINTDNFKDPDGIAQVVACAFEQKFSLLE